MRWDFTQTAKAHMLRNHCTAADVLGAIPSFLSDEDPRGAVEQIDVAYKCFGGWRDSKGWTLDYAEGRAKYPGDPPRILIAETHLRDELILFFNGAYIAVMQPDGSFRMARID